MQNALFVLLSKIRIAVDKARHGITVEYNSVIEKKLKKTYENKRNAIRPIFSLFYLQISFLYIN